MELAVTSSLGRPVEPFAAGAVGDWADQIAVQDHDTSVSFGGLLERAMALGDGLDRAGAAGGGVVAVVAGRSVDMVVGVVAAALRGMPYVLVDPALPRERVLDLVGRPEVVAVSSGTGVRPRPGGGSPTSSQSRHDVAYQVYTSGSTGSPKAVVMPWRSLSNAVSWFTTIAE